jgi:hypothetical protein
MVNEVWADLRKFLLGDVFPCYGESDVLKIVHPFFYSNLGVCLGIDDGCRDEVERLFQAPRMVPDGVQEVLINRCRPIAGSEKSCERNIYTGGRIRNGRCLHVEVYEEGEWVELSVFRSDVAKDDVTGNLDIL